MKNLVVLMSLVSLSAIAAPKFDNIVVSNFTKMNLGTGFDDVVAQNRKTLGAVSINKTKGTVSINLLVEVKPTPNGSVGMINPFLILQQDVKITKTETNSCKWVQTTAGYNRLAVDGGKLTITVTDYSKNKCRTIVALPAVAATYEYISPSVSKYNREATFEGSKFEKVVPAHVQ